MNRAKTKRWVEAKSFAYDGDDWGEADEFDEYGGPSEPASATSRPTGLRQKGQAPPSSGPMLSDQGSAQPLNRQKSFDAGDERRTFSSGAARPMPATETNAPPTQAIAQYPPNMNSRPHPTVVPPNQSRVRRTDSLGWENASNVSAGSSADFQQRRDFSPSAMPPPLATRPFPGSPSTEGSPAARHPPRKSSLSQQSPAGPASPFTQPGQSFNDSPSDPAPKQMSPAGRNNPDSEEAGTKPLPFIRPADIYKRIEEERQKERASTDSERPSLDSLTQGTREPRSRSSSGSHTRPAVRKPSFERNNENSPFSPSRTPLEPVQERKSVYEPLNPPEDSQASPVKSVTESPQSNFKPIEPDTSISTMFRTDTSASQPMLPQFDPSSAFGDEIWQTTESLQPDQVQIASDNKQPAQVTPSETKDEISSDSLQHHPSLGFRSVVHQAFDRRDDRSVPPTPSSSQDPSLSRGGSEVSRSNTDSTAGISPIISRAPSTAANNIKNQAFEAREYSTPAIAEEPDSSSLHDSRRTSTGTLQGTQQIPRKPSPSHSRDTSVEPAKGFIPGYRRNLDPPSSENSPARTPNVEENQQIGLPETGEVTIIANDDGPADPSESATLTGQQSEAKDGPVGDNLPDLTLTERSPQSPIGRAESPSKGRVRDLAGRFNYLQSSSNRSSTDSLKLKQSSQIEVNDTTNDGIPDPPKNLSQEHDVSTNPPESKDDNIRPHLPGGWVSYAPSETSAGGVADTKVSDAGGDQTMASLNSADVTAAAPHIGVIPSKSSTSDVPDLTPTNSGQLSGSDTMSGTTNPIAAMMAAGSAIAASITQNTSARTGSTQEDEDKDTDRAAQKSPAVGDVYARPLAPDRNASSTVTSPAPTPLPKDTPPSTVSQRGFDYFETPTPSSVQVPPRTNTEDSLQHSENERLRREITRQLSPETPTPDHQISFASEQHHPQSEYESFGNIEHAETSNEPENTRPARALDFESQPLHLAHRFSWENDEDAAGPSEQPVSPHVDEESERAHGPQSPIGHSVQEQEESVEKILPGVPDPNVGASNMDNELAARPQSSGQIQGEPSSDGFQQTFSEPIPSDHATHTIQHLSDTGPESTEPVSSVEASRIPPFREILAIKSASDRIITFNRTREQFANLNSGLSDWVAASIAKHPEHASLTSSEARAAPPPTNITARHKASPSLMKLGKLSTTGHSHRQSVSSNFGDHEEAGAASSPTKPQGNTGRVSSQQMQAKGKDLLKNAGVLSGKATTGAKGLFAKGRNKLQNRGSEKVDS